MDERQDPRARLRALRAERGGAPPDREEPFLHGVLGEPLVAQHAQREAVGDAADPVVQLSERVLVTSGDQRDERLVGEMSVLLAHGPPRLGGER